MIVNGFRFFISFVLFLTPLLADNYKHDPNEVFLHDPVVGKHINPIKVTNAARLHALGIKGGIRTPGKRPTAAIIDVAFDPTHTNKLRHVIHPDALKLLNPYALSPDEKYNDEWGLPFLTYRERLNRKTILHDIKRAETEHGSAVMAAMHKIAPEAQILPIDLFCTESITKAIRLATAQGVDVINMSLGLHKDFVTNDTVEAIAEAVNRGIVVVIAAGNGNFPSLWRTMGNWDTLKERDVFDRVKRNNLIFAGSLGLSDSGEEKLSDFSQYPNPDEKNRNPRFILAPGEQQKLPTKGLSQKTIKGTSFSAPVIAGGYLALLQGVRENRILASSNNILDAMEDSGKPLSYSLAPGLLPDTHFKSLDLLAAKNFLDQNFKRLPPPPPQPIAPVIKPTLQPIAPTASGTKPLPKPVPSTTPQTKKVVVKKKPVKGSKPRVKKPRAVKQKKQVVRVKKPRVVKQKKQVVRVKKPRAVKQKKQVVRVKKPRVVKQKKQVVRVKKQRAVKQKKQVVRVKKPGVAGKKKKA